MFLKAQNPLFVESVAPLGVSAVFTSPSIRQSNGWGTSSPSTAIYNNFNVQCTTDQASATNGLVIQGSQTLAFTTPVTVASTSVVASTPITLSVPVAFPYYRVVLTNGAVAQTTLSLVSSFTL